ncbi:MAG: cation:proton antiporter [Candidatus Magasanikbacteria bacterium]
MSDNIFLQISVILGITVSIACIMRLLRQPLVVAYIVAGLVAGPLFLDIVHGAENFFDTFAQFGIVLLLFIVGLSLDVEHIKKMGRPIFVGTFLQFVVTAGLGYVLMTLFHFSFISSLFISISVAFSSTIIVIKLLAEKKDLETVYGRYVIGVLLVQDIIAIGIMIFLNTSKTYGESWYVTTLLTLGKGFVLVGLVVIMSKYLLPFIMDKIARSGELLFIFTIAWCFGVASLVYVVGFSIEIGAIIAGISLGATVYQSEISSRIRPLRDFFIVLFFVVLGSELQFGDVRQALAPGLVLSLFVLIIDPFVLYHVMRKLKYTRRSAFLAGITAAQVSEFGFILVFKGTELGYLHGHELAVLTIVALITIVVSSYLITYNEQLYQKLIPLLNYFGKDKTQKKEPNEEEVFTVWVFGYHRIGWKVCEALAEQKISFAVVDYNPESVEKLKRRGIPAFFGDASDVEFLDGLPLDKAKLIISTIPEPDDEKTLITHVRRLSSKPLIIANLYHNTYLEDLYEAGADYVMMPHLLGGQWIVDVLKHKPWSSKTFKDLRVEQKNEMKLRYTTGHS